MGQTLEGEMKDVVQDKLPSADVDRRHPANRNKWDRFDLNSTCRFREASLRPAFTLPFTPLWNAIPMHFMETVTLTGNKTNGITVDAGIWQHPSADPAHRHSHQDISCLRLDKLWFWETRNLSFGFDYFLDLPHRQYFGLQPFCLFVWL